MPWFQIEPQWAGAGKRRLSIHLEAETWMDALKDGARKLRPGSELRDIQVHFDTDGAISVLQPADGVRLRIVQLEGPPQKPRRSDDPSTLREARPLVSPPKLAPGVRYPTYSRGRPALPPPPTPPARPDARRARAAAQTLPLRGDGPRALGVRPPGELPTARAAASSRSAKNGVAPYQLPNEALARIKRACWSGWNRKAADGLLELALELVPSEAGSTYRAVPETGELELVAAWGPRARRLLENGLTLPPGEGLAGFAAQQRVLVVVSNPEADRRFRKDIAQRIGYSVGSALVAPIVASGTAIGCVQLLNCKGGSFSDMDSLKLSQLVRAAANCLTGKGGR